jgi:6-pyruvoyltetrahydropterin/6-carboxytetrahydropterin synthase
MKEKEMKIRIGRIFKFDAAHYLPNHKGKCKNLHGHCWKLEVEILGEINETTGMVLDFGDLNTLVQRYFISWMDHSYLNDKFKNPTSEELIKYLCSNLVTTLELSFSGIKVTKIVLWETENSYAEWRCEDGK